MINLIILLFLNCHSSKNVSANDASIKHKIKEGTLNIDSIIVYTATFVGGPIYSPVYYYQDSLFCNYDTLKMRAIERKQVYKNNKCQSLIDSIERALTKVRPFISLLKDSSDNNIKTFGSKNCQFDFEVSDLFEVYIGNIMVRIGMLGDNNKSYNIEGSSYNLRRNDSLFLLFYRYRNSVFVLSSNKK